MKVKTKRRGEKSTAPLRILTFIYAFQIMSATVLPAGMNGITCVL